LITVPATVIVDDADALVPLSLFLQPGVSKMTAMNEATAA
jgi:hypothetical protein